MSNILETQPQTRKIEVKANIRKPGKMKDEVYLRRSTSEKKINIITSLAVAMHSELSFHNIRQSENDFRLAYELDHI